MLATAALGQMLHRLRGKAALRSRLAPTPSGWLHAGNGASFVITWLLTRSAGGRLLLRIDDLDRQRRRPEYLEDIFRTIDWLGIDYDAGPSGPEDFLQHWSQTHRGEAYATALDRLWSTGRLYACDCSRRQVRDRHPDGIYRGYCRERTLERTRKNLAWRYRLPPSAEISFREATGEERSIDLAATMGDFVVRRKNGAAAYQVASVIDDDRYAINFVVRGADLLDSTTAQLMLAKDLPDSAFAQTLFFHHPLLLDDSAAKLSKSAGAQSLRSWRDAEQSPAAVIEIVKTWLGAPSDVAPSLPSLLDWLAGFSEAA